MDVLIKVPINACCHYLGYINGRYYKMIFEWCLALFLLLCLSLPPLSLLSDFHLWLLVDPALTSQIQMLPIMCIWVPLPFSLYLIWPPCFPSLPLSFSWLECPQLGLSILLASSLSLSLMRMPPPPPSSSLSLTPGSALYLTSLLSPSLSLG